MTHEEVLSSGVWNNEHNFSIVVYSELFLNQVKFEIILNPYKEDKSISSSAIQAINDFIALKRENLDWIKSGLFADAQANFENASYNCVNYSEDQTESESNRDYFKVYNEEDAYSQSNISVIFADNEQVTSCFLICFKKSWDDHETSFVFVNGKQDHVV